MGALVNLKWSNGIEQTIYLTTAAIEFYQNSNVNLDILKEIPDDIINVFNLSGAVVTQEGVTYQELLNYYLSIGLDRDTAVKKAQSQIGISKEQMIDILDVFQKEIISDKAAKIAAAEIAIQEQTDTQKTTFEDLDLSEFGDSAPKINTDTLTVENLKNLPDTKGDISKESLDFTTSQPEPSSDKTKTENKDTIDKSGGSVTIVPIFKSSDSEDFKSFGLNIQTAIALGIATAAIIGVVIITRRKK